MPSLPSLFISFLIVGTVWSSLSVEWWYPVLMTIFVFAAPAQFLAFEIIQKQNSLWLALLSIGIINLRLILMSYSLLNYFEIKHWKKRMLDFCLISATTFAISQLRFSNHDLNENEKCIYFYTVCILSYLAGILGTLMGPSVFHLLPSALQQRANFLVSLFLVCKLAQNSKNKTILFSSVFGFLFTPICLVISPSFGYIITTLLFIFYYLIIGKNK